MTKSGKSLYPGGSFKFRHLAWICLPCSLAVAITACSSHAAIAPVVPLANRNDRPAAVHKASWKVSPIDQQLNGSLSFSDAVGKNLVADADFAPYIDKDITGSDRVRVIHFLRLMPANLRGDFIYFDRQGRLLSNHQLFIQQARLTTGELKQPPESSFTAARLQGVQDALVNCSGGPCAREYSSMGVAAAYGYATVDCNDMLLFNPVSGEYDNGYMYTGAYAPSSGIDGGLQVNGNSPASNPSIQPFMSISSKGGYQSLENGTNHYSCGFPVGLIYGELPDQSDLVFAAGVPTYDPRDLAVSPSSVTWTNGAWIFTPPPPDMVGAGLFGTDGSGLQTPCNSCIAKRMLTIGMTYETYTNDTECFGACNGTTGEEWNEWIMGELIQPCSENGNQSEQCTIEYQPNGSWFGNFDVYPDPSAVQTNDNGNISAGTEGINIAYEGQGTAGHGKRVPSEYTFTPPPLPSAPASTCTPDSKGYCWMLDSKAVHEQCDTGVKNVHGQEIYIYAYTAKDFIFKGTVELEVEEIATDTQDVPSRSPCTITDHWSPAEPKITYNDPNLP